MTYVGAYFVGDGLLFLELMISKPKGEVLKETIFLSVEVCPNKNSFFTGDKTYSSFIPDSSFTS